ncbi:MAG: hypothetical protein QHI48_02785 [Bacteroidota bacterium]|nr:hypothetical protein [Bacteroidota bacterium]
MTDTEKANVSTAELLARMISVALVPPTWAALGFAGLVAAYESGSFQRKLLLWLIATGFNGLCQIVFVLYLKTRNRVTAYDIPKRRQRTGPYVFSVVLSLVGLLVLASLDASAWVLGLTWCYAVNTGMLAVVNRFWKMSAHMMGMMGPLTALFPTVGSWMFAALPIAILLGWSRLRLKAHTPAQVVAGGLAGILLTAAQLHLWFVYGQQWQHIIR